MTGVHFPAGAVMEFFSLRHCVQTGSDTLTIGIKQPGRESDHLMRGAIPHLCRYVFTTRCLIKQENLSSWRRAWLSTGTALHFTSTMKLEAKYRSAMLLFHIEQELH
jgi:hypothetical protein